MQFSMFFGGGGDSNPLGIVGVLVAINVAPLAAMILQLAVPRSASTSTSRRWQSGSAGCTRWRPLTASTTEKRAFGPFL